MLRVLVVSLLMLGLKAQANTHFFCSVSLSDRSLGFLPKRLIFFGAFVLGFRVPGLVLTQSGCPWI